MTDEAAVPNDMVPDYAGLAGKYLAMAQQTNRADLRSTYLSLAAGYDQLAQFSERMKTFLLSREAGR